MLNSELITDKALSFFVVGYKGFRKENKRKKTKERGEGVEARASFFLKKSRKKE